MINFWKIYLFQVNLNIVINEQEKDSAFTEERRAMSPDNKLDLDEKRSKYIIYNFNILILNYNYL